MSERYTGATEEVDFIAGSSSDDSHEMGRQSRGSRQVDKGFPKLGQQTGNARWERMAEDWTRQ